MADEQQEQQPSEQPAQESSPPASIDTAPAAEGAAAPTEPTAEPAATATSPAEPEPEAQGTEAKAPPLQAEMEKFRGLGKTAFVAGYTGECGKALVQELARTKIFSKVLLIGRREVPLEGDVYKDFAAEQKVVDYDKLDDSADIFKGPTVGYCCLGTTRGKAGKDGFKKVDYDYVMKIGELAKQNGCEQYHLVSSVGANANSSMLYTRVKGQTEEETAKLEFEKFTIYRPGMLMCDREEFRLGERLMRGLLKPVDLVCPGSFTNTTLSVAMAMIAMTVKPGDEAKMVLDGKAIYRASKEI
ncbi:oxidoreductase HTATIP2-like isoform X2 [Strongylocentrotus purpuratus]|uniref:Protein HTATIP2 n=1 Tax=Strongylocentrotus purpuratus TaxID=7668 RepID=A0A7M7T2I8_STRPU|nr:oxidoreductase HTATIP2-like isoform X2 [Strongylocentrotus purpuratus]